LGQQQNQPNFIDTSSSHWQSSGYWKQSGQIMDDKEVNGKKRHRSRNMRKDGMIPTPSLIASQPTPPTPNNNNTISSTSALSSLSLSLASLSIPSNTTYNQNQNPMLLSPTSFVPATPPNTPLHYVPPPLPLAIPLRTLHLSNITCTRDAIISRLYTKTLSKNGSTITTSIISGLERIIFKKAYCFLIFQTPSSALAALSNLPPLIPGCTLTFAKKDYHHAQITNIGDECDVLYIGNEGWLKEEVERACSLWNGYREIKYYPEHSFIFFTNLSSAQQCLNWFNGNTNVAARYSKKHANSKTILIPSIGGGEGYDVSSGYYYSLPYPSASLGSSIISSSSNSSASSVCDENEFEENNPIVLNMEELESVLLALIDSSNDDDSLYTSSSSSSSSSSTAPIYNSHHQQHQQLKSKPSLSRAASVSSLSSDSSFDSNSDISSFTLKKLPTLKSNKGVWSTGGIGSGCGFDLESSRGGLKVDAMIFGWVAW